MTTINTLNKSRPKSAPKPQEPPKRTPDPPDDGPGSPLLPERHRDMATLTVFMITAMFVVCFGGVLGYIVFISTELFATKSQAIMTFAGLYAVLYQALLRMTLGPGISRDMFRLIWRILTGRKEK